MGGYDYILPKYDLFSMFVVGENEKLGFVKKSFLHKSLEVPNLLTKKYGKPTLYSLIANHVLEMSVKLKLQLQCVGFEKKHSALMVLIGFLFAFIFKD